MPSTSKKTSKRSVHSAFEYITRSAGISEYRHKQNGLRVLIREEHTAPVVTLMVTYHVGSRNEAVGYTGATHILEHLMFEGTKRYPNPDQLLSSWGAQVNATTWVDRTNYFETFPKEHLVEAIDLEADRMRNIVFTEKNLAREMPIVRNELEFRVKNDPSETLDQHIWATAYHAHPYHHPTIGWEADIENISVERLKEFHETYYWPNNATVTVIGDVDPEEALTHIDACFGAIPQAPHAIPEVHTWEPEQRGERFVSVERDVHTNMVGVAHRSPHGLHRDMPALQVISRILTQGKASRLYRALVDRGLATSVFPFDFPMRDPGLFIMYASLVPGVSHDRVRDIIRNELHALTETEITEEERERAVAGIVADTAFARDGSFATAEELNEAIAIGDWRSFTTFPDRVKRVTARQVQEVAQKYFTPNTRTTGYFVSTQNTGGGAAQKNTTAKRALGKLAHHRAGAEAEAAPTPMMHEHIQDTEPIEGMTLTTLRTGVRDAVTIEGSILGGVMHAPDMNPAIPVLAARMMEQDTKHRSREAIDQMLASMGAEISLTPSTYRLRFAIKCLKDDIPTVITLLGEALRTPAFLQKRFTQEKKRLLAELREEEENTRGEGKRAFLQMLYPEGHPHYEMSVAKMIEWVEETTRKDVRDFALTSLGMGPCTVVASGDVPHSSLSETFAEAFNGWRRTPLSIAAPQASARKRARTRATAYIPDKGTTDFYIGHALPITRDHPDYYALITGITILGDRSFFGRLMRTIRNTHGLSYGAFTSCEGVKDGLTGYWFAWSMFAPSVLARGKQVMQEEIQKFAEKGVTAQELKAMKQIIRGRIYIGSETSSGVVNALLFIKEQQLPLDYFDTYLQAITKLTRKQVNEAIKAHIHPDALSTAVAGSVKRIP